MIWGFAKKDKATALHLYNKACHAARQSGLFRYGLPKTPDGYFFSIALHLILLMKVLEGHRNQKRGHKCAQHLFSLFCQEMDDHLREMGFGDISVVKQVKHMGATFAFYQKGFLPALEQDKKAIAHFIQQTISPEPKHVNFLASYFLRTFQKIKGSDMMLCSSEKPPCDFISLDK